MGRRIAVIGDYTTTGGRIISGNHRVVSDGSAVAVLGDKTTCPKCKSMGTIIEGAPTWLVDGKPAAYDGCIVVCGCRPAGNNRVIATKSRMFVDVQVTRIPNTGNSQTAHSATTKAKEFGNNTLSNSFYEEEEEEVEDIEQLYCRYCSTVISEQSLNDYCTEPDFKKFIRKLIDTKTNNINIIFAELLNYYLLHIDVWEKSYLKLMFSDLCDIVGKNYYALELPDQNRFVILSRLQKETLFVGQVAYSNNPQDNNYDKVQHCTNGLYFGSKWAQDIGYIISDLVEEMDTMKAKIGDLIGKRASHHVGYDLYDHAWTMAGSTLGALLIKSDIQRVKTILQKFTSQQIKFDSFYVPPSFDYYGQLLRIIKEKSGDVIKDLEKEYPNVGINDPDAVYRKLAESRIKTIEINKIKSSLNEMVKNF